MSAVGRTPSQNRIPQCAAQAAPAHRRRSRINSRSGINQVLGMLKGVVMLHNQSRFPEEYIESDIFISRLKAVLSEEQREASVAKDGRLGNLAKSKPNRQLPRMRDSVHSTIKVS